MSKHSSKSRDFFKLPKRRVSEIALFLVATAVLYLLVPTAPTDAAPAFSFEVAGKVQGVSFRRHTRDAAAELGLVGWVQNTPVGTVIGEVAGGDAGRRKKMRAFLRSVGSPRSRIDAAAFEDLDVERAAGLLKDGTFHVRKSD